MERENAQGSQAPNKPHTKGLSVVVNPDRPDLDIVFVHGFTGHPERTWTNKAEWVGDQHEHDVQEGVERPAKFRKLLHSTPFHQGRNEIRKAVYWPRDLVPITAPHARVLTYGYDTHVRHWLGPAVSKNTVYDIAGDFLVSLEAVRHSEPLRPLLFIAHSLGGIIVKEALRRSRSYKTHQTHLHDIFESTAGIVFFGTPHGGADPRGLLQHIAEKVIKAAGFSANEKIVSSLLPSSERLRELREDFGPMARQKNWIIYSFQEQYGVTALSGNKVVEDVSSCLNDSGMEITQYIANNHMDMCRFGRKDDPEYGKVVAALNRVLERIINLTTSVEGSEITAEQRQNFLDSLRFDQIDARHATIKTAHAKTCKWLLEKAEYQDWVDFNNNFEHRGFLWIKGKPGTGKSTIMKFVLAQAKKTMTDTIIISFFFNARGEDLEKSTIGMYRSLLVQLLEKAPELQSVLDSLGSILPSKNGSHRWDIEILKNLFRLAVEQLRQRCLTCFIDALDECEEDQIRDMVADLEHLGQLAFSTRVQFRVCFSSRHYPHITIEKGLQLILEGQNGHNEDIAKYLHSELKIGHSKPAEQVRIEIIEKASGIFMWVVLVVQMLNKEYDRGRIHALRKRLQEIPAGLNELFKDILMRDCQNMEELLLCLQWILYAKRPLKQEELYFAILSGVEPEDLTAWSSEDITKEDMKRFILSSSKGLAEVTKTKGQMVQFIHESVRDFLLKENALNDLWSDYGTTFPSSSHERLKQCCYNYMKINTLGHLSLSLPLPPAPSTEAMNLRQMASEKLPFLEYAVCNVLYHADLAESGGVPQSTFLEHFPLGDWTTLNNLIEKFQIRRYTPNASLLYILAEGNLPNLIRIQLRRVSNMDIMGERYCFPIFAALANGNENAVRAFLLPDTDLQSDGDVPRAVSQDHQGLLKHIENIRDIKPRNRQTLLSYAAEHGDVPLVRLMLATRKIDLEAHDKYNKAPLALAVQNNHEAVVKLLLATGRVEPDSKDGNSWTPLSWAASNGHEEVVKILLATGRVEPDSKSITGRTPLSWAAEKGDETIVKLLLATGRVEPDSKDGNSWTPLSWAASNGHEEVVKILLATGRVEPDSKSITSRTPLSWAAEKGDETIVKLLLATGRVEPDSKDGNSWTPLSWAASNGHEEVVKILLATGRVEPDLKDKYSWTPLSRAAEKGHEAVVKLLLATGRVDPDSKDGNSQTPLSRAAEKGDEAVVKLLLATGRVEPDSKDGNSWTPLSRAASNGHEEVVKLFLATGRVEPDLKDKYSWTPLSRAAEKGHEAVVKLLLATGRVDPDSKDGNSQTPLSRAAEKGDEAVVKLLLATGRVEPDSKSMYSQTLLLRAAENRHESGVKLLLATGRVEPDSKDGYSHTPLLLAAWNGHEAVVKLLLATGRVEPDSKGGYSRTPLSWAASNGHEEVVKLLLTTGRVEPDSKSITSRTPLSWAAENGHKAVVELLLATGRVEPDSKDKYSRMPLSWAAEKGDEAVVKLLLATGRVEPDSKDINSRTPLSWAAEKGNEAVVKLLLATGRVEPDSKSIYSQTLLLRAAENRLKTAVELLLAIGRVELDSKDGYSHTPLLLAAWNGHEAVVKLLLATGRVEPDSKGGYSRTPLSWAASNGHEEVVKLLLATGRVEPDSKDKYSRTPLSWAAGKGDEAVVKLLLTTGRVEPDSKDINSRTPLSWAAEKGDEAVVKLLLATGRVEPDSKDGNSRMPLSWAACNGHEAVVELLKLHGPKLKGNNS